MTAHPPAEPAPPPPRARLGRGTLLAATILLAVVGVQFWLVALDGLLGMTRQRWVAAGTALAATTLLLVPVVRRPLLKSIDRLRRPSARATGLTALGVAVVAGGYLYGTAVRQGRTFQPTIHDEYCYLTQARMIAAGRFWMPRHELADSFDTFHMISDPVYAAKYFPGNAIAMAGALELGLAPWLPSLIFSALAVGLCYVLLTELLDGWAGLVGAVCVVSIPMFRRLSVAYLSQPLFLVLGLGAFLAYLRWRRAVRGGGGGGGWMVAVGACVGGAMITRPLDAACLALPLAVAIAIDLFPRGLAKVASTVALGAVGVAPFVALQLACNRGITGRFTETPWSFYARHDDPYDAITRRPIDPAVHTRSAVPQKRVGEERHAVPAHQKRLATPFGEVFLNRRLQYTLDDVLPWPPLAALMPLGLLALTSPPRWALWVATPLFALAYAFHAVYLSYYALAVAPAVIFAALAGARGAGAALRPVAAGAVNVVLSAIIAASAVAVLPEVTGDDGDDFRGQGELRAVDRQLAALANAPSIVLFRFDPIVDVLLEPVYNTDVAWPDDARVIRAHFLDPQTNQKLFGYYAQRDPERRVYRYDRGAPGGPPIYLGTARELAARGREETAR